MIIFDVQVQTHLATIDPEAVFVRARMVLWDIFSSSSVFFTIFLLHQIL